MYKVIVNKQTETEDNWTYGIVHILIVTHIFAKHSNPLYVYSDHRSDLTSHFFHSLESLLQMHLHLMSGQKGIKATQFFVL